MQLDDLRGLVFPDLVELSCRATFEDHGVDVTVDSNVYVEFGVERAITPFFSEDIALNKGFTDCVECKPLLGDDYPAVLRQMNANGSRVLLLGEFSSEAIGRDDLVAFFKASGKKVVFLSEVEAAISTLPEWTR